jgi:hypothetical protein
MTSRDWITRSLHTKVGNPFLHVVLFIVLPLVVGNAICAVLP